MFIHGLSEMMHPALIVLSVVGLYISLYFTLVYYRLIAPNIAFIPAFCRMEESTCHLVIHHPDARALGVPNSLLGTGYYVFLIFVGAAIGTPTVVSSMRFVSWIPVALGVYLVYSLFFKVKALCPLCLISHGLNLAIALLFTLWWR